MFAIERIKKIKQILLKDKRVDVVELSERFSVTEVTIRRDLDKLEQQGFLVKIYGGAVLNEEDQPGMPTLAVEDKLQGEKRLIGQIASRHIENGEAIFIGTGTTCLEIARHLKEKKVTVVTNDLLVALALKDTQGVKVMLTGGDLIAGTSTLIGGFALQTLSGIYVTKAFIGVKGAHFQAGYTVDSYEEAMMIQSVQRMASEIIIAADYTKFDAPGFAKLGELTMAGKVITNKQLPAEYKKYYFEHAIKLYTTFELE
ncbi:DeoR/GlpR family DNA-binding transcription regulator [Paenibacillus sp. Leaf72]|uniref:DeoR/GlpR family DNA-binding transcription regulator n=1 Tax=Paenibacillus sp. Leaf72 TaxID=1736234 RepID=UPI0006F5019B|nr:DeoR/GlpR family DNA-binding transcription regulator [Paenibacillus sp. Leaf72]KQN97054.1 DeoR family transcriptional regulator [Paenibacillus sp. Leaf72]